MKLISCHIENFGNVSCRDFDFVGGLNPYYYPNGYGKTTLACFLKAMFYGLPSDRANVAFNERRRFFPFSGGNFGGFVVFEAGGDEYKVERYFDIKSETKDTVAVYKNGVADQTFTEVGEKFFGIDRDSFERTAFITSDDVDIAPTDGVNAKLNVILEGSGEDNNLANALKELEERSKIYKKQRGGGDLITREREKIAELNSKIEGKNKIAAGLPEKYARLDALDGRLKELGGEIARAQSENVVLNNWERYDSEKAAAENLRAEIKKIAEKYPYGMPTEGEAANLSALCGERKRLEAGAEVKTFTAEDGAKLSALSVTFADGAPTDGELDTAEENASRLNSLNAELEALSGGEANNSEQKLRFTFSRGVPTEEEVAALDRNFAAYQKRAAEKAEAAPKNKKKSGLYAVVAVCAAIALIGVVCGAVALALDATTWGIISFAASGSSAAVAVALFCGIRRAKPAPETEDGEKYYAEIQAALLPYGYSFEYGAEHAVASFKEDLKAYGELLLADERAQKKRDGLSSQCEGLKKSLGAFFAKYGFGGENFLSSASKLRSAVKEYTSLCARKREADAADGELKRKIAENSEHIASICRKYGFSPEKCEEALAELSTDRTRISDGGARADETEKKAEAFAREKGLTVRPEATFRDMEELNGQAEKLRRERETLFREVTEDEREAEEADALRNEYEASRERLAEYKYRHELLENTAKFLKLADDNLKEKYVKPIKDKFRYYSDLIEEALGEKITFGGDFEIRFLQDGKERSERHLSAGQRSVCALCFRLALLENMYADEKPFLVLDDPFVNLDGEHLKRVGKMLAQLSEKWQMIYFSCHESRNF